MKLSRVASALALYCLLALVPLHAQDSNARSGPRFDIWEFQVSGNSMLDPRTIEKTVYPFLGPSRAVPDVEQARQALEALYRDAGFGAVAVNIPEQDVDQGIVKLEGVISSGIDKVWLRIDEARNKGVECGDIVLAGFSLGGYMAAQLALRAPEGCDVGGVVVMSGGGAPAEAPLRSAEGRSRMRVLVAHGKRDRVVPLSSGQNIARHFQQAGHVVQVLEFDGAHEIPPEVRQGLLGFLTKAR